MEEERGVKDPLIVVQPHPVVVIPIAQAYPVFSNVRPLDVPSEWKSAISPELWGIIQSSSLWTIRQHVKLAPKTCCSCPPCIPQENTYSIYAGLDQSNEKEIMRADEVSNDCNRCCCRPYHPFRLEFRQYIPMPGDGSKSDYSHIREDVLADLSRPGNSRQMSLRDFYKTQPVLLSMVRDDGMRCCYDFSECKCLRCCVCCSCCADGVGIYAGSVPDPPLDEEGKPTGEIGRPYNLPSDRLIASVTQPIFAGWCIPTLDLRADTNNMTDPFAKFTGPCIFGGWSEMCCDFKFFVSKHNPAADQKLGDVALVTKKAPTTLSGAFRELASDADVYHVAFDPEANEKLTPSQKIAVLSGQLLSDYMLFDGQTGKCTCDDDGITCYFFYCSVIGCLWPCSLYIPYGKDKK